MSSQRILNSHRGGSPGRAASNPAAPRKAEDTPIPRASYYPHFPPDRHESGTWERNAVPSAEPWEDPPWDAALSAQLGRSHRKPSDRSLERSGTFTRFELLRKETLRALLDEFEEFMGYAYDVQRVIGDMGYHQDCLPRPLAAMLIVELSKRLHPGRRIEFLRSAEIIVRGVYSAQTPEPIRTA